MSDSTVTCTNCQLVVGMSWRWVLAFAREHSVPVWRVGRKQLVPVRLLLAAVERASSRGDAAETTEAEGDAAFQRRVTARRAARKRK